eukprot:12484844-Prorocentrum_lima.AAC.1
MTSSLVGSEMCIRDSLHVNGVERAHFAQVHECSSLLIMNLLKSIAKHVPVSYTHLTLPTICSV